MGAFWIAKFFHLPDPAVTGSKNPGATNIYRLGGWLPALLTLVWDAVKGAIPTALAVILELSVYEQGIVVLAALIGHMLPMFHKFRGGKGVATVFGCGLVMAPLTILSLALIWSSMFYWRRISSVSSLTAAVCAPWLAWWLDPAYASLFMLLALFILVRHRENIVKLARGGEQSL